MLLDGHLRKVYRLTAATTVVKFMVNLTQMMLICPTIGQSCRDTMARFHGSIEWLDHWFGELLAAVDRLGYREDTIIIFTTDHGIHGPRSKTTLYDRGVEIACLISLPHKAHAGLVVDHLMQKSTWHRPC